MKRTEVTTQSFIKHLLEEKIDNNPNYSLRAFSSQINVSPSHISRILSGKKAISTQLGEKIIKHFRLKGKEAKTLLTLIAIEKTEDLEKKAALYNKLEKSSSKIIDLESFKVLSDWYHFAILSLCYNSNFQKNFNWIGKRLGIGEMKAKNAWNRLRSLELINETQSPDRVTVSNDSNISTTDDISSSAIQKFHFQACEKAQNALSEQTIEEREFGSIFLSIKKEDIPKFKKIIRTSLDELNNQLDTTDGDEVYQLNLQFYKVTK